MKNSQYLFRMVFLCLFFNALCIGLEAQSENLSFHLRTGFESLELGFEILDEEGEVAFVHMESHEANTFSLIELSLEIGCYTVEVMNSFLLAHPMYCITNEIGDTLIIDNLAINPATEHRFCVEAVEEATIAGINTLPETANVSIYPNPTNGQFLLEHNLVEDYQISIQNLLGQTVAKPLFDQEKMEIKLEDDLPNGIYVISIENKQFKGTYKVLLEK